MCGARVDDVAGLKFPLDSKGPDQVITDVRPCGTRRCNEPRPVLARARRPVSKQAVALAGIPKVQKFERSKFRNLKTIMVND